MVAFRRVRIRETNYGLHQPVSAGYRVGLPALSDACGRTLRSPLDQELLPRHHQFDEADIEGKEGPIRKFMPGMRDLSEAEHPFSGYQYVRLYDTMLIEPPIYLNAMLTDFRIAGGSVRMVKFAHLTQLQQLIEPGDFQLHRTRFPGAFW